MKKRGKKRALVWGNGNPDVNNEDLKDAAFKRWIDRHAKIGGLTQSPIETKLAMIVASIWEETFGAPLHVYAGSDQPEVFPEGLSIIFQAPVGPYFIDFILHVVGPDGTSGAIAVECDGHEFHERTKEQAAHDRSRDRAVMLGGLRVIRFTGSEIYRDPMACAEEALMHVGFVQYEGMN